MLKGITYRKSKSVRAMALVLTVVLLAVSLLAPFTYIVQGDQLLLRFNVEDYDKEYTIRHNGINYAISVHIPGELYYSYADEPRMSNDGIAQYAEYVVVDDVVQDIATQLKNIAEEIDDSEYTLASLILKFVHQTDYMRDDIVDGIEKEYPKTPVETLVENGDCEDLSALFVSIALAVNLDAVMFMFPNEPGHMAGGIYIGDGSAPSNISAYWTDSSSGKSYYFCECTGDRGGIGQGNYDNRRAEMNPITDFPNV